METKLGALGCSVGGADWSNDTTWQAAQLSNASRLPCSAAVGWAAQDGAHAPHARTAAQPSH